MRAKSGAKAHTGHSNFVVIYGELRGFFFTATSKVRAQILCHFGAAALCKLIWCTKEAVDGGICGGRDESSADLTFCES